MPGTPNHPHPNPLPGREGTRRNILPIALLLALTLLTYAPAARLGFVNFDDPAYVTDNTAVRNGLSPGSIAYAFRTFNLTGYNPLTWLSLELDVALFGTSPAAMHVHNVLLHAASTALVLLILRRMRVRPDVAFVLAAVFGVHPLHVESVAWISERKDVLCGLFFLLAVYFYLCRRRGVLVACLLALAAKPMAVTLPAVLLLLDLWPLGRWRLGTPYRVLFPENARSTLPRLLVEKWPLWALSLLASIGTVLVQRAAGELADNAVLPLNARLANVAVTYTLYLDQFTWPIHLAAFYPYQHWSVPLVIASAALLLSVTAYALLRPQMLVGWLWFVGMLVPTIGLIQAGGQAMADRYLYLPMIGLLILAAAVLEQLNRRIIAVVGSAVVIALSLLSVRQIGYWQNTRTLFRHTLAVTGPNALAHVQLGLDDASSGDPSAAEQEYQQAIAIDPSYFVPEFDLGNLLLRTDPAAAAVHYARAAALRPGVSNVENNWGLALLSSGQPQQAALHFRRAVDADPGDPNARRNLRLLGQRSATSRQ